MLNNSDIETAAEELEAMPFFPSTPGGKLAVMKVLRSMVDTKKQLDWLTFTMVNRVGKWKGCAEMRGVFCTRFKPADGIEMNCVESFGFTPEDGEAKFHEIQQADQKRLAAGTARLMIEGHIPAEEIQESERARVEAFDLLGQVKDVPTPERKRRGHATAAAETVRREITQADFDAITKGRLQ